MPGSVRQNPLVLLEQGIEIAAAEFYAALPQKCRAWFGPARWVTVRDAHWGRDLSRSGLRPVAITVPESEVLLRYLDLPLVSRWDLSRLMPFELLRQIPVPLDHVHTDYRIVRRDVPAGRMLVELAILRRETVGKAREGAVSCNVVPESIEIYSDYGVWHARRLLSHDWRDFIQNRRIWRMAARFLIPFGLTVALVVAAQNWTNRLVVSREAALAQAQQAAKPIVPLRQELAKVNAQLTALAQMHTRASTAAVTEEVARLLPDGAWLQELDIEDHTVTLRGTAQHATDLLRIFSASPLFSNVQFEAPLTQAFDGSGELCDIAMTRN